MLSVNDDMNKNGLSCCL